MSKNTVLWPIACLSFQQVDVNTICYHKKAVKHVLLSIFLIYEINTSIYLYSVPYMLVQLLVITTVQLVFI